jgi:hypothetical protein
MQIPNAKAIAIQRQVDVALIDQAPVVWLTNGRVGLYVQLFSGLAHSA